MAEYNRVESELSREERETFYIYCCLDLHIIWSDCKLMASTTLAKRMQWTLYKARKIIKSLVDKGLLESGYQSLYNEWNDQNYIVRGYRITDKGRQTLTYKKFKWEEAKGCTIIFRGGKPSDFYKIIKN